MEDDSSHSSSSIVKFPHHIRSELCTTRPPYRQGRKLTSVKVEHRRRIANCILEVYTVNEESQHVLIRGVPVLDLRKELKHLCMRYGEIKFINLVRNYSDDEEAFTEVYHVSFARIQSARFAKHMIDDKSFFGGVLHVCYAPELESVVETRQKLQQRRHDVLKRTKKTAGKVNQMLSTKVIDIYSQRAENNSDFLKVPSTSRSNPRRTDVTKQLFIPRKRQQSTISQGSSVPVHGENDHKQYFPVKNESISSSSRNLQIFSQKNSRSFTTRLPDKFIPSPLKRIKFNKNEK